MKLNMYNNPFAKKSSSDSNILGIQRGNNSSSHSFSFLNNSKNNASSAMSIIPNGTSTKPIAIGSYRTQTFQSDKLLQGSKLNGNQNYHANSISCSKQLQSISVLQLRLEDYYLMRSNNLSTSQKNKLDSNLNKNIFSRKVCQNMKNDKPITIKSSLEFHYNTSNNNYSVTQNNVFNKSQNNNHNMFNNISNNIFNQNNQNLTTNNMNKLNTVQNIFNNPSSATTTMTTGSSNNIFQQNNSSIFKNVNNNQTQSQITTNTPISNNIFSNNNTQSNYNTQKTTIPLMSTSTNIFSNQNNSLPNNNIFNNTTNTNTSQATNIFNANNTNTNTQSTNIFQNSTNNSQSNNLFNNANQTQTNLFNSNQNNSNNNNIFNASNSTTNTIFSNVTPSNLFNTSNNNLMQPYIVPIPDSVYRNMIEDMNSFSNSFSSASKNQYSSNSNFPNSKNRIVFEQSINFEPKFRFGDYDNNQQEIDITILFQKERRKKKQKSKSIFSFECNDLDIQETRVIMNQNYEKNKLSRKEVLGNKYSNDTLKQGRIKVYQTIYIDGKIIKTREIFLSIQSEDRNNNSFKKRIQKQAIDANQVKPNPEVIITDTRYQNGQFVTICIIKGKTINLPDGYWSKPQYVVNPEIANLTIGNSVGEVTWRKTINVKNIDFSKCIKIMENQLQLYEQIQSPPIGVQLNQQCFLTLYSCQPLKKFRQKNGQPRGNELTRILQLGCKRIGVEFVSFNTKTQCWTIKINPRE